METVSCERKMLHIRAGTQKCSESLKKKKNNAMEGTKVDMCLQLYIHELLYCHEATLKVYCLLSYCTAIVRIIQPIVFLRNMLVVQAVLVH